MKTFAKELSRVVAVSIVVLSVLFAPFAFADGLIGIPQRIKVLFVAIRSGTALTLEDAALNDLVVVNDTGNPDVRIALAGNGVIENATVGDNEISLNASSTDIKADSGKPVLIYNETTQIGRADGSAWTLGDTNNQVSWTYATDTLALSNSATIDFGNDDGVINGIATIDRGSASSIGIGNEATDTAAVAGILTVGASVRVNSGGEALVKIGRYTGTIDVGSIAANTCTTANSITATGVASQDACVCTTDLTNAGLIYHCYGQTNSITLNICNNSASAIDPASTSYSAICFER